MKPGDLLVSKYRLERVLGVGGMGKVWAAINEGNGRPVAIKLMHALPPKFRDRTLRERMLREARAGGALQHKNIVDVYDVGETESGDPFLVMERLSGETLADLIQRKKRLPPEQAASIALSIAAALRVAHAKGIVHRDLKPANVFLHRDADGDGATVKVLDFGASKHLREASATAVGSILGSPAYMSPEQASSDPNIDARADLWSLGVVIFEMVAGRRPFLAETTYAVIGQVIAGPIPSVGECVDGVRPELVEIIARCLTRDVDARVQSAEALIELLGSCLDDRLPSPRESSPSRPLSKAPAEPEPPPSQGPVHPSAGEQAITNVFPALDAESAPALALVEPVVSTSKRRGLSAAALAGASAAATASSSAGPMSSAGVLTRSRTSSTAAASRSAGSIALTSLVSSTRGASSGASLR